jgi:hypothetical protein
MLMIFSENRNGKVVKPNLKSNLTMNTNNNNNKYAKTLFKLDMFSRLQNVSKCNSCGN